MDAAFRQGDINHVAGDIQFATALLQRRKTVLTVLDAGTFHRLSGVKKQVFRFFWFTLPIKQSAYVTTISDFSRQEILKVVGVQKQVIVIPVAVSDLFQFQRKIFQSESPRILIVGTAANKNIKRMIEALESLPCKLIIVGNLSPEHVQLLKKLNINYENYVDLPLPLLIQQYEKCDILAFCSTYEGFGMPIVEANSVGRVVVTSNVASIPEIAGDAACLVDPLSVESIRSGIRRVIHDNSYRESLIANGLINAKRFRPEQVANQYWNVYSDLLEKNAFGHS